MILETNDPLEVQWARDCEHVGMPYHWNRIAYKVVRVEQLHREPHLTLDGVMSARITLPRWEITLVRI